LEGPVGRLREVRVFTRPTSDGRGTISFRSFIVEMPFSPNVKLNVGKMLAVKSMGGDMLLLEIVDFLPLHYSMINLEGSIPKEIRDEVMSEVDRSWETGSPESWIEVYAVPVGYLMDPGGRSFWKGYAPPFPASNVYQLNREAYQKLVCSGSAEPLGQVVGDEISLRIDVERAVRYHVGVFAFTGSGKSNLVSLLVRRALASVKGLKVVVFDISMEYFTLLFDQIVKYNSRVLTSERLPPSPSEAARRFMRLHVIPEELEDIKDKLRTLTQRLMEGEKIRYMYVPSNSQTLMTYGDLSDLISGQINDNYAVAQKPILFTMLQKLDAIMRENRLSKEDIVDEKVNSLLDEIEELANQSKLRETSSIYSFINGLRSYVSSQNVESVNDQYDLEKLSIEILEDSEVSPRLFVVETPKVEEARFVVSNVVNEVMSRRKKLFSTSPSILFVLDEAQEFIPFDTRQKNLSEKSSEAVEKLLRQGRKYHLHSLISSQRLAYLNTNALQQLHTYFVSTLPRPYDRQLVGETFAINDALLDRTLELETGEWLLISFKSATPHDIPVFFKAENNFSELRRSLGV